MCSSITEIYEENNQCYQRDLAQQIKNAFFGAVQLILHSRNHSKFKQKVGLYTSELTFWYLSITV